MDALHSFFKIAGDKNLPFVVYRKPGEAVVHAILQNDDQLHTITNFKEEGFVFAPFDSDRDVVYFPIQESRSYKYDLPFENNTINKKLPELSDEQKEKHLKLVQKGINAINTGELKKVVLSRKHKEKLSSKTPYNTTVKLFHKYPSAFVYCWFHPRIGMWLGATPETLLTVNNRQLHTMSLAGTQPYEGDLGVDWGEKELEEQSLVTDAIVEGLLPFLDQEFKIEGPYTSQAGSLLHLKTDIRVAVDRENMALKEIINALHPTPAICGLPKEEARSFIIANEDYQRLYYTGYLGELNIPKEMKRARNTRNVENLAYGAIKRTTALYVNLRCMQWEDNTASIYVGGGITSRSLPEKEWEETVNKLRTMHTIL